VLVAANTFVASNQISNNPIAGEPPCACTQINRIAGRANTCQARDSSQSAVSGRRMALAGVGMA
jgi:hypothetical protein